jgi:hypothetical protein
MPADPTFLDRLDAAIGCQQCGGPLTDSVSDYFCGEQCSTRYGIGRAPYQRTYDYFENVDEDEHGWTPEDLTDLEPVGWITPPAWRLPRSTGDLEADQRALERAEVAAVTGSQMRACAYRRQSLAERRRVLWAKNWRLPRSTGDYRNDLNAVAEADRTATTDAQRAACELRRESLTERRKALPKPEFPGRSTSWGLDRFVLGGSPLIDTPIVVRSHVSWNPARSAVEMSHERPVVDSEFNARGTFEVRGQWRPSAPEMLRYELRRDSDGTLMFLQSVPDGQQISVALPYWVDVSGCTWRILNSRGGVIREFPATSRALHASPDPAPDVDEGDTIQVTRNGETLRYVVEAIGPGSSMTLRRHPEDDQPPAPNVRELTAEELAAEYWDSVFRNPWRTDL